MTDRQRMRASEPRATARTHIQLAEQSDRQQTEKTQDRLKHAQINKQIKKT